MDEKLSSNVKYPKVLTELVKEHIKYPNAGVRFGNYLITSQGLQEGQLEFYFEYERWSNTDRSKDLANSLVNMMNELADGIEDDYITARLLGAQGVDEDGNDITD